MTMDEPMITMDAFIALHHIGMLAKRATDNPRVLEPLDHAVMDHWRCYFTIPQVGCKLRRLVVPFSMGAGHHGVAPTAAEVLSCLASDAASVEQPFEEWARDLGFDPDSRAAEHTYRLCVKQTGKLHAFLGDDLLHTLLYNTVAL